MPLDPRERRTKPTKVELEIDLQTLKKRQAALRAIMSLTDADHGAARTAASLLFPSNTGREKVSELDINIRHLLNDIATRAINLRTYGGPDIFLDEVIRTRLEKFTRR